ncbi:MAG: hypothetical protein NWF14_09580 [Candidatus Bathyarchaeota archaeon]|nr:hypothetical protein [Candidatus Bathyarchaeota archaeon]
MKFDPLSAEVLNRAAGLVGSACQTAFGDRVECVITERFSCERRFHPGLLRL